MFFHILLSPPPCSSAVAHYLCLQVGSMFSTKTPQTKPVLCKITPLISLLNGYRPPVHFRHVWQVPAPLALTGTMCDAPDPPTTIQQSLFTIPTEFISIFEFLRFKRNFAEHFSDSRSWHSCVCPPFHQCDITPKQSPALNLACRTHTAFHGDIPVQYLGTQKEKRSRIKSIRAKTSHRPEKG